MSIKHNGKKQWNRELVFLKTIIKLTVSNKTYKERRHKLQVSEMKEEVSLCTADILKRIQKYITNNPACVNVTT